MHKAFITMFALFLGCHKQISKSYDTQEIQKTTQRTNYLFETEKAENYTYFFIKNYLNDFNNIKELCKYIDSDSNYIITEKEITDAFKRYNKKYNENKE